MSVLLLNLLGPSGLREPQETEGPLLKDKVAVGTLFIFGWFLEEGKKTS